MNNLNISITISLNIQRASLPSRSSSADTYDDATRRTVEDGMEDFFLGTYCLKHSHLLFSVEESHTATVGLWINW